jgi:hypothetical protein
MGAMEADGDFQCRCQGGYLRGRRLRMDDLDSG